MSDGISFEFNEEQNSFRRMVRDFAEKEVGPLVDHAEETEEFPVELFSKLAELGLLGITYEEKYGGVECDKVMECIFVEEMSKVCAGIAASINAHADLASAPIAHFGTEDQKERYLVPAIAGEKIGCFALTEPDAGSDVASIGSSASKKGNKYILNGRKNFITNGGIADFGVVAAYTDKTQKGKGISLFVVDFDSPGFERTRKVEKMGHHSSDTWELLFENVEVPEENLLGGEEGKGFGQALATLETGRISHAAKSIGMATAALNEAVQYAKDRNAFGRPLGKFQIIQFKLAQMATRIEAGRNLTYKAAWLYSCGKPSRKEASMAKLFCTEVLDFVAYEAVQIFGGYGYSSEYAVERIFRDARLASITEGTTEMQYIVVSREVLGDF